MDTVGGWVVWVPGMVGQGMGGYSMGTCGTAYTGGNTAVLPLIGGKYSQLV